MWNPILYEPDPEIERTLYLKRKKQMLKKQKCKARETSSKIDGGGGDHRRTLRDLITPGVKWITSSIIHHSPQLRAKIGSYFDAVTITFWWRLEGRSYCATLSLFIGFDTLKLNEVSNNTIHCWSFPFLLKDKIRTWLYSLPPRINQYTGWPHQRLPC